MTAHSDHHDNLCPSILDGISDEIIVIDREYNLIYGNKSVQGKFGDGHREGEKCYAVLHGEEKPCDPCPCQEAFKTGKPYRVIRKKDVNGHGPSFLKEFRAYPIFDQTGQVIRVVEVIQDISPVEERPAGGKASDACSGSSGSKKEESLSYFGMIGASKKMKALFHLIRLVSPSHATVLVYGESGTGKEMVAQAIHQSSPRRRHPFIAIDCGALPETLLESELFGHVKGAFTGAIQSKKGLFEEAEGGTLFLDEIGDTSLAFQSKLLRVLQEGEVRQVGGNRSVKVNVRVVAATNKPLKEAIAKKSFREDLYYRLAVMPIVIPPLRERPEDVPLLAGHFIEQYTAENGKGAMFLSEESVSLLMKMPWKGNVRELENVIERAVLVSPTNEIAPESLLIEEEPPPQAASSFIPLSVSTQEALSKVEKERIIDAIQKSKGNKSLAARALGISRASLYNKIKQYQIG